MNTNKTKGIRDKSDFIFYLAIIAIPILQVIIFYFIVNFNSILMAFQDYNVLENKFSFNNFANFKTFWDEAFASKKIITMFFNSFVVWFFTSVLGTFLSILFSYYIFKKWKLFKAFKFILFLPTVLPSILLVLMYKFFMTEAIPLVVEMVTGAKPNDSTLSMPLIIFYNVWVCFGAQILIYSGAMDQIPPDVLEAGQVDGVNSIREFFSIVVPIIMPTVSTFFIASVATLFTNQANLFAFFGTAVLPQNQTIGYYLFKLVNDEKTKMDNYGYASALGIICTFVAFPLTLLVRRLLNGKGDEK